MIDAKSDDRKSRFWTNYRRGDKEEILNVQGESSTNMGLDDGNVSGPLLFSDMAWNRVAWKRLTPEANVAQPNQYGDC